ncbi:hypothetical protein BHM03_00050374 [Ensete ventricosum]|nr:hypothetical protein BHM03_00050374 [Ensete ventricosum]
MNGIIMVFDLGSSPTVTGRVMVLRGEMESPVNTVREEVMGIRGISPRGRATDDNVDLLLDRAFRVRGGFAQLSNVAIEMSSANEVYPFYSLVVSRAILGIVRCKAISSPRVFQPLVFQRCALRESVKTKKRVFDSGRLGVGVLESGVIRSVVLGAPERNFEGCCGLSTSDYSGAEGPSRGARKSGCHQGNLLLGNFLLRQLWDMRDDGLDHPGWGLYLIDEPEEGFNKDDREREKGLSSSPGSLLAAGISSPRRSLRSYYHEAQGIRSDVVSGTLGGRYGVGWSVTSQDLRWRHTVGTVSGSRVAALSRDLG